MSIYINGTEMAKKTDTIGGGVNLAPHSGSWKDLSSINYEQAHSTTGSIHLSKHAFYKNSSVWIVELDNSDIAKDSSSNECRFISESFYLDSSKTYTFSFEGFNGYGLSGMDVWLLEYNSNSSQFNSQPLFSSIKLSQSKLDKRSVTFTPHEGTKFVRIRFDNNGSIGNTVSNLFICNWKVEEGTTATTWSPAPEDTQSDIISLQSQLDALKSKLGG